MFELIDPSVTVDGRPVSDWVGKVTRANVLALAERGPGGGYVWSREVLPSLVGALQSQPSPVSTHPDFWYSIPFTLQATPYQTELTVELRVDAGSVGMRIRLWCEGVADASSAPVTGVQTLTRTVTIPPRPAGTTLRCAVLLQSVVGAEVDSGNAENATVRGFNLTTNAAPTEEMATHYLLEIGVADDPIRGWQGETRYHTLRGVRRGQDVYEVWPRPDQSLIDAVNYTVPVTLYELGTVVLYSVQVRTETGAVPGLPQAAQSNAGTPVRATWLSRMGAMLRRIWQASPQYAWIGGVGGLARSTGTSVGQTTIPYRLWGAWMPRYLGTVAVCQTVIRYRSGTRGVTVSVLYASSAPLGLTLDIDDGADEFSATLPMAPAPAQERNRLSQPGTLHWRHAELTRDQCSSQDLGLHGPQLDGYDNDTSRLSMASVEFPFDATADALVRLRLSASCGGDAYIAAVSIRETIDPLNALAQMTTPVIAPLQDIDTPSWDALRQRMDTVYATRVRAIYSEWSEAAAGLVSIRNVNGTIAQIAYRTSPDLPPGSVIRLTAEGDVIVGTACQVALDDGTTTVTVTFTTTRSVQTVDLAVTSDTAYLLTLTGLFGTSSLAYIYLLRLEEVT